MDQTPSESCANQILISGSTGLIGRPLVARLAAQGHRAVSLSRGTPSDTAAIAWSPDEGTIDSTSLERLSPQVVIHLAGEPVFGWWTRAKRERIEQSRSRGTMLLARSIARLHSRPRVLLSASAVGYYGDTGDREADESAPSGAGFLADVCRQWEAATAPAADAGIRVVLLRIGVVLSRRSGALKELIPIYRLGLGGPIAGGRAWVPWISLDDTVDAVVRLLRDESVSGPVNIVGPQPVRQREFALAIGAALHRPARLPAPRWLVAALGGEMARETALKSVRAVPRRLLEIGFRHQHPTLQTAVEAALREPA